MMNKTYAKAYKEVITILTYVPEEDLEKIPQEKIDFYIENMDPEYEYILDETKEFEEQEMSETTKAILANIFRDYWATPYQKERIIAKEKFDLNKEEEQKRDKYNPDKIFKNNNCDEQENIPQKQALMVVYRETLFRKIINKIKGLFHLK